MTVMTQDEIEALLNDTTPGQWTVEIGNVPIADTGDYDGYCRLMAGGRIIFEQWGDDEQSERDANLAGAAPDIARTALALHQQLTDAQAARALVVERAEIDAALDAMEANMRTAGQATIAWRTEMPPEDQDKLRACVRAGVNAALADPSGVEALAALRAERDADKMQIVGLAADNDRLRREIHSLTSMLAVRLTERAALAAKLAVAEARVGALKSLLRKSDDALDGTEVNLNGDDVFRSGDDYYTIAWLRTQIGAALAAPTEETKG